MKNWNKTGHIKTIILGILFFLNLIVTSPVVPKLGVAQYLLPLIFGALVLPLIIRVNIGIGIGKIEAPSWNDNPLKFSRPLVFYQFGAWFMITNGSSMVLGSVIIHQTFHTFGFAAIMFGIGILIGIQLAMKWFGK